MILKRISGIVIALLSALCLLPCGMKAESKAESSVSFEGDILRGTVSDLVSGEPLIGAALMIESTASGAVTDIDGKFELSLPAGNSTIAITYIGYRTAVIAVETFEAGKGKVISMSGTPVVSSSDGLLVCLEPDNEALADAVVTARKNLESLQALRNERMNSGFAIENMGAREMSIKGISNAQESVAKLSGISIASAGQLIVRGLGDRYSTTTLNGLPIASPNPDNKLIPLDIFPASTIQNITVSKVYEASSFADYSGAHVDISTKEGKGEDFLNMTFSTGGYLGTIFQDAYSMDRPSLFVTPVLDKTAETIPYRDFDAYSRGNGIFDTSFNTFSRTALPDLNGSVGYGKNFNVGSQTLSLLASASIKSGSETVRDAFYRTYEASSAGAMMSEYDYSSYSDRLDIAALLNLEYTLRENDHIGFTAFFARNAESTYFNRHGMDYHESYDLTGLNQVSRFYMLQDYQLSGHHETGSWEIDWGASYGMTSSDEPDRRQVMFINDGEGGMGFFQLNQQETQRYFGKLAENELVADIRASYDFDEGNIIRFGLTAKDKVRGFKTSRFYYDLKAFGDNIPDISDLDSYINQGNIGSGVISVDRKQHKRDKYNASNVIGAAFIETDLKFGGKWFLNAGLRLEASRQSVDYNDDVEDKTRNLDAFDLFPAINLKYNLTERSIFRLSMSRTITRPSFVEMAPFLYQESFGGEQIRGNEALDNGYNYNADLKYEFFSSRNSDMFSVSAYFKYLDNPIERTQRISGGATEHSFQNADNGIAAGVEAEVRKQLVKDLVFTANASYMYTNVVLPEGGAYTNMQRSLQGASPYLANADISWTPRFGDESGLNLTLLYNLQGPRIHAVGIMGLGDVRQLPFHSLDIAAGYDINSHWSVKLGFKNLLDSAVRFRQDIPSAGKTVDVEQWRSGTGFELGISWAL